MTSYTYDSAGNLTGITAPDPSSSGTATVTTRYAYNAENQLCRVLENASPPTMTFTCTSSVTGSTTTVNVLTSYAYDGVGNLTGMTDARGKTTTYAYDANGQLASITDPNAKTLVYRYDALGRRTSQENRSDPPLTNSVTWTYDGAGRVLTRSANSVTVTTTHDDTGNRLTVGDGTRTITSTYDRLNRPLSVSVSGDSSATTTYTYSLTSPSWTDPTGTYTATLDKFDRQTALTDPIHGASTFTWTYRADGPQASSVAPNAKSTVDSYDDAGRGLGSTTTGTGGAARAAYTLTRNRAGQVTAEASTITGDPTNGTTSFTYDARGRITGFTRSGTTTSYGWQAVPNRDSVQVGANPAKTYTFDNANRLTADSAGGTYTHDFDGRMTARPGRTLHLGQPREAHGRPAAVGQHAPRHLHVRPARQAPHRRLRQLQPDPLPLRRPDNRGGPGHR